MNGNQYQARRATLEDLARLRKLWQQAHFPAGELEKRFTEFQLVENEAGQVIGAAGLHIEKNQGHIHHEAYASADEEEFVRPVLWDRIQRLAKNHGLARLWTLATIQFYRQQGMVDVDESSRLHLPSSFGHPAAEWLTIKLKEEIPPQVSVETELQLFSESQKESTERVMRQAQFFKTMAYALLALVLAALAVAAFLVMSRLPNRKR